MKKFLLRGFSAICGLALTVSLSASALAASLTVAEVTASELNFRKGSGTQYEIIAQLEHGSTVVVESTENGWSKVLYCGQEGYVSNAYLKELQTASVALGTGTLTGDMVRFRTQPSLDSETIAQLKKGSNVEVIGISGDWYQVNYQNRTGYLYRDYVSVAPLTPQAPAEGGTEAPAGQPTEGGTEAPAGQPAEGGTEAPAEQPAEGGTEAPAEQPPEGGTVAPAEQPPEQPKASAAANAAAKLAQELLGIPYVWGGANPDSGFDCSGLVQYCYSKNSVSLERTASAQFRQGTQVNQADLLPGDLVFFAGTRGWYVDHVGIYIGDGKFVHASSGKGKMVVAELSNVYFAHYYYGACRVSE